MKFWLWVLVTAAVLALGIAILPRGIAAAALIGGQRDEAAVADYLLSGRSAAHYEAAAARALAEKDDDLAASIRELANARGVALSPALTQEIAAAEAEAQARMGEEAWNGFLSGDASSEAALAGAVAADLTGVGDLRDLFVQARRQIAGEGADPFIVGLAGVGLALSVATIASDGLALPARTGVSTLKAARRAGRLSPALVRQVGRMAGEAVDGQAFRSMAGALKRLDIPAARTAAYGLIRPAAVGRLSALGADVATIGGKAGYRATLHTLKTAETAEDVARTAKLSSRFGKATRGVLVMAGTAVTFMSVAGSAAFWTLSMLGWAALALLALTRLSWRIGRLLWRPRNRINLSPPPPWTSGAWQASRS
ncbi:hypothetical protein [Aestuariivirga sp.]|uniref:hypothetical protein n=1 Tax=Aestuariivirga sp. TaxID=2650926 RepID=UPI00391AB940